MALDMTIQRERAGLNGQCQMLMQHSCYAKVLALAAGLCLHGNRFHNARIMKKE
jgi:hypothetical protein